LPFELVCLGADHGGFDLKEIIKNYLNSKRINFKDFGTFSKESVNYVDYAILVAKKVAENKKKIAEFYAVAPGLVCLLPPIKFREFVRRCV